MTREDLKYYKHNQEWIKERLEYIERYKTTLTNITSVLRDMPHSSNKVQDKMAENIAIMLDNVNDLIEKVNANAKKQKLILEQLEKVEQPYRLILEKVYIQGKSLVTVASEMNYSYRDLCRKNGIALNKFEKV